MEQYLFTFEWTSGNKSRNDYIIQWCKEQHISWRYDGYFNLEADVFRTNTYLKFELSHISDNLYGVSVKETT